MEFIKRLINNNLEIIAILISLGALFVAIKSWSKSRAIYKIEKFLYFTKPKNQNNNIKLNKKLKSGKYSILHIGDKYTSNSDGGNYFEIILSKLKK